MYPIFVVAVLLVNKHAHSRQRKATPTQTLPLQVKPACPASSAFFSEFFQHNGLVWSNIRNSLDAEKAEKLVKIYRFYRPEEYNH